MVYKKRGQFYLLAAIVIIALLIGFASLTNYISKKGEVKIYDLKEELGIESGQVLDYGTYGRYSTEDFNKLLENFTRTYTDFAGAGKELYFVFGNKDGINVATYSEVSTGSISLNIGGGQSIIIDIKENEYNITKVNNPEKEDKIRILIGNIPYDIELTEGQNFYFIISQEISGEVYIESNK